MNDSLSNLYTTAVQKVEVAQKNDDAVLTTLSKSRLVWVGGILRDGQSKLQPNLYRSDVPDGLLWVVVPTASSSKTGKLVQVGRVNGNVPALDKANAEILSGRPLFWTRELEK
jgi:hypothetical protein